MTSNATTISLDLYLFDVDSLSHLLVLWAQVNEPASEASLNEN